MHQTDTKPEKKDILRRNMKSNKTYIFVITYLDKSCPMETRSQYFVHA